MKLLKIFSAAVLLCTCFAGYASQVDELDRLLKENYKAASLAPVKRAGDDIFLRRVMIDVTGKVPTIAEVRAFTADKAKDKRRKLIAKLLDSPGYADMMAMRFADMFRIKSEFPINLWPNAVQSYHRYFRDAAVQNRPWDKVARELLTASGSNFRVPAANFFPIIDTAIKGILSTVAVTSLRAYNFLSAGVKFPDCPMTQMPVFLTISKKASLSKLTLMPGIDSNLSTVPPV